MEDMNITNIAVPGLPYTGISTFLSFPYSQDISDKDAVFFGMPYDCATTNRPGCRFGPRAIRDDSFCLPWHIELDFDMLENLSAVDYGDFAIPYQNVHETMLKVTEQMSEILNNSNAIPIGIGGDHALTFAELRAFEKKFGPMAFIHFDSHTDTWDSPDEDGNTRITHGTPFRCAIKNGSLDASHGIQLGLRSGGEHDHDFALEHGMELIHARELHDMPLELAAARIRNKVGDRPAFVTFDIDFLDPAFAPGTGTPVVGGFTTAEALKLLRLALPGLNIKGFDLVEVAPQYDPSDVTCLAARTILREFLAIISYNKNVLKLTD